MNNLKYKSPGFTLIEILVAVLLLGFLSIGAYSVLQSSMDATIKGKVQQDVQTKASAIINAITSDLKSSFPYRKKNNVQNLNFHSSVIFPDPDHPTTLVPPGTYGTPNDANRWTDNAANVLNMPGLETENARNQMANNINRLVFYSNFRASNGTNNFLVTEYRVSLKDIATGLQSCFLERLVWDWDANADNTLNDNRFQFNAAAFVGTPRERHTIVEMTNPGDVIILYTARNVEPQQGVIPARLSPNQYFIRTIVAGKTKANEPNNIYTNIGDGRMQLNNDFATVMTPLQNTRANRVKNGRRANYRTATLDASVTVPQ